RSNRRPRSRRESPSTRARRPSSPASHPAARTTTRTSRAPRSPRHRPPAGSFPRRSRSRSLPVRVVREEARGLSDGRVVGISMGAGPGGRRRRVSEVVAVAGRGLEGDRYFQRADEGEPADEITLVESEGVEAAVAESGLEITLEETRRNIVT